MSARRYARVPYPWKAVIDVGSPGPARFYAGLVGQALRYGLPASRRFGPVWALAGRRGLPERLLAASFRTLPRRPRPDVDDVVERVAAGWGALAERSERLPADPPPMTALALERRAALTVFVFGKTVEPLVVVKVPPPGDRRAAQEARALEEAEPARLAPRYLGALGETHVQEALAGAALRVEPLTPARARVLEWPEAMAELARGFRRLGEATAKGEAPDPALRPAVERAIAEGGLDSRSRDLLAAALRDFARLERSVLWHRDPSPQNCIFSDGRLSGVVDWETAGSLGPPGLDVWIAALSYLEMGLGLVRWSQDLVVDAFAAAWRDSPFYRSARAAGRTAAAASGVPDHQLDALELVFFGLRLGHRLERPAEWATSARAAARMLEVAAEG